MSMVQDAFRSLSPSALMERIRWAQQAGFSFLGQRDLYKVLGYERMLTVKNYRDRYARGGIAGRIVDALPNASWRGDMELVDDEDPDVSTAFEIAWRQLDKRLRVRPKLLRADKLSRLSSYSIVLIGAEGNLDDELPKGNSPDQILYLAPYLGGGGPGLDRSRTQALDADATILSFDENHTSPRFGRPEYYQLNRTASVTDKMGKKIHWSRVVHLAENVLEDEVYGQPALERVWNLLDDLDKVTGGGAEAYWLRVNKGLHFNVDKDAGLTKDEREAMEEKAEEYQHQMRRWLITRKTDIKDLGSDVADMTSPADAILTQIAGATGIPKRILTGSEMGQLASTQDRDNWRDQINGRQSGYLEPYVVRQLVDRLVEFGYLPAPENDEYTVLWPQIQTMTETERVAGAKGWAQVNSLQGEIVYTGSEIRDKWSSLPPLDPEDERPLVKYTSKVDDEVPEDNPDLDLEIAELEAALSKHESLEIKVKR
jgi:hypothetical protein